MLGYTHFAIAATTTGAACLAGGGGTKSLSLALVAGLAALLPDIDEPESVASSLPPSGPFELTAKEFR